MYSLLVAKAGNRPAEHMHASVHNFFCILVYKNSMPFMWPRLEMR